MIVPKVVVFERCKVGRGYGWHLKDVASNDDALRFITSALKFGLPVANDDDTGHIVGLLQDHGIRVVFEPVAPF